jgi:rSAM/selenodomain-associated transferase 1
VKKKEGIFCEQIVVLTRYPVPGRTKTRLIQLLGAQGAADLQRKMTEHTLVQVERLRQKRPVRVEVRYDGCELSRIENWLDAEAVLCRQQGPGDLGDRMHRAFSDAFNAGMERIIIVGSDCPALSPLIMEQALDFLKRYDVVIGPAVDGGYYLIGLRSPARSRNGNSILSLLFGDILWGTEHVLDRTLFCAEEGGLSVTLLEPLDDVDRPEDLCHFHSHSSP